MRRLTALLVLALTLMACQKSPESAPVVPQKIVLSITRQPQVTLVHVAIAKGYFAQEGLAVQAELHTFGKAALQMVLDKQADVATAAETPIMFSLLKGEPIKVLANIGLSNANNAVVARRDAGIGSVKDLKGKRVGFTPGTTSDYFLASLLTANGLTRQDVLSVALKPEDMQEAVLTNKVAAVSTWNYPLTEIARALGANGQVFYDKDIYTETFNLVARQDYLEQHPQEIQKLLRALLKAKDFARTQPQEAQAIMAQASGVELGLVREVWDYFDLRVALDQILLLTLEDETRWAIDNRLTEQTRMPDYRTHVYFDGLAAVLPAAISIPR